VKFRNRAALKAFLDEQVDRFNRPSFIEDDPISIPRAFSKKQDIEISGLFASVLAWGQRTTIIRKCRELMEIMDNAPYDFVMNHGEGDLRALEHFKHRTFNGIDALYFVEALGHLYRQHSSLEEVFRVPASESTLEQGLIRFYNIFFSIENHPARTRKHIATPERKSSCKRLNMYLRWMVRRDDRGVDFGIWRTISMAQLVCPCDVHVDRVARKLGLIRRKQTDWQTALELTANLRKLDSADPVKYDFALFGMGVMQDEYPIR
jgi:uncharacterized protein (TIGR02757 family)